VALLGRALQKRFERFELQAQAREHVVDNRHLAVGHVEQAAHTPP